LAEVPNGENKPFSELIYFAIDMRGMSARAIAEDDPARVVLPVWRFACRLRNRRAFDILAEAVQP
jgi:hypothetical protein